MQALRGVKLSRTNDPGRVFTYVYLILCAGYLLRQVFCCATLSVGKKTKGLRRRYLEEDIETRMCL